MSITITIRRPVRSAKPAPGGCAARGRHRRRPMLVFRPAAIIPLPSVSSTDYKGAMSDPVQIGERIRAARQARGMTQEQLADEVGVSRSAVAQWETGRAGQLTGNLSRIAEVLGVGIEHLA